MGSGTEGLLGSCMSLGLFCSMLVARHSRCKKIPDVFSRINRVFDCSASLLSTTEKDTHLHQTQNVSKQLRLPFDFM